MLAAFEASRWCCLSAEILPAIVWLDDEDEDHEAKQQQDRGGDRPAADNVTRVQMAGVA